MRTKRVVWAAVQVVHGMEVNWPAIMVLIQYVEENQTCDRPARR